MAYPNSSKSASRGTKPEQHVGLGSEVRPSRLPNFIDGSATCVNNFQAIVYSSFAGTPLKTTFLDGRWWVTTPGEKLQLLENYFEGEDIGFNFLCEADGKVGALALTKMLGKALEEPEEEVDKVLRNRVSDLKRLGVELDVKDEALMLELQVVPNEGKTRRQGKYSVWCHLADNFCEMLFDIDAFETKKDAEEWSRYLFDYLEELGVKFTIV